MGTITLTKTVTIDSITPGTGATDLGKAEDAAHASGDVGVMALTVRKDTPVALAGSDGDYQPPITSSTGHLHSKEGFAPAYEDNDAGKAVVEHRYSYARISTATTTVVKSGAGLIHTLTINTTAAGTITIYDNTSAAGTVVAIIKASAAEQTFTYDVSLTTGLTIVTAGASDITVSYR